MNKILEIINEKAKSEGLRIRKQELKKHIRSDVRWGKYELKWEDKTYIRLTYEKND